MLFNVVIVLNQSYHIVACDPVFDTGDECCGAEAWSLAMSRKFDNAVGEWIGHKIRGFVAV